MLRSEAELNAMPPKASAGGVETHPSPCGDTPAFVPVGKVDALALLPTIRLPAMVTVPVAWITIPLGMFSVMPVLIEKFVH
jgi:hypothetical protein